MTETQRHLRDSETSINLLNESTTPIFEYSRCAELYATCFIYRLSLSSLNKSVNQLLLLGPFNQEKTAGWPKTTEGQDKHPSDLHFKALPALCHTTPVLLKIHRAPGLPVGRLAETDR